MKAPQQISRLELTEEQRRLTNFVGALAYDSVNDGLWIGSNDGMFFYRFSTESLEEPFDGCQEVRGCIGSIVTRDGHLWMGCIQGVRIVDLKSCKNGKFQSRAIIHLLNDPDSKIVDKISSFCEASDGTLWLGSNGYGLYRRVIDKKGH
jgi:ligand-binding sensor domain-containing protein